jgi:hypothetical protein
VNHRIITLLLAFVLVAGSASAAILIREGQPYAFPGYLILLNTPVAESPYVALSAFPNGIHPPHWVGRQDLALHQTTQTENLLTLARRYGPKTQVAVKGTGFRGGLKVTSVTLQPPPSVDLLARYKLAGVVLAEPVFGTPPPHPIPPHPKPGVKVTVSKLPNPAEPGQNWVISTVTAANGHFRFERIGAPVVLVRFEVENYATVEQRVDLRHVHNLRVVLKYNGPPVPTPPPPHGR